jgi:hypothetical protein
MCRGAPADEAECVGYILGVVDHLEATREYERMSACVRVGVESDQVRDVVVKYLTDNPQVRDQYAWGAVVAAVVQAWSCNK